MGSLTDFVRLSPLCPFWLLMLSHVRPQREGICIIIRPASCIALVPQTALRMTRPKSMFVQQPSFSLPSYLVTWFLRSSLLARCSASLFLLVCSSPVCQPQVALELAEPKAGERGRVMGVTSGHWNLDCLRCMRSGMCLRIKHTEASENWRCFYSSGS